MIKKTRPLCGLLALLLCLSVGQLWGQNVSIQGRLDRSSIRTGEQAVIDLQIRTNDLPNTKFYLTESSQEEPRFKVLAFLPVDTVDIDGQLKEIHARMVITSFDSTLVMIPPIVVEAPSGSSQTEIMAINVVQPDVDLSQPEKIKAEKEPWTMAVVWQDYLILLFRSPFFWLFVLLLIAAYTYYRRRQMSQVVPKIEPQRSEPVYQPTALEEAIEALQNLAASSLLSEGDYKGYYTQLVDTLKAYIHAQKGWHVQEQTSSELLRTLEQAKEPGELIALMKRILNEADASKFAKASPTYAQALQALRDAEYYVRSTDAQWRLQVTEHDNTQHV